MARRIQLRRDTAANWAATNPVLAQGEIGIDLTNNKIKIGIGGDPASRWNNLPYWDDKVTDLSSFAGSIIPSLDNTYDLGSSSKQWRHIYVNNGSIYIGDIKLTNNNGQLVVQQVTNPGQETEAPVPNTPGSVTTDRLVNGENTFVLLDDGTVEINGEPFVVAGPQGDPGEPGAAGAKGDKGDPGENGVSFIWRGLWDAGYNSYGPNDVVLYQGSAYVCVQGNFNTPPDNQSYWNLMVQKGDKGDQGEPGGGSGTQLVSAENNNTFSITNSGDVVFSGETGGRNRGLVWDYGAEAGGVDSMVHQNEDGLTVRAYTEVGMGLYTAPVNIVTNQDANERVWQFNGDGDLTLPAGGDILDSEGNSVLGGGTPTIPNTIKGFINLVGDRPNNEDDIAFEAVVVCGNYAYVLGSDYYILDSDNRSKVYKFDLRTGEQVWVKQIGSGKNATFNVLVGEGQVVIDLIATAGVGYKAGEEIKFRGSQIGGSDFTNDFIIIADTVDETGSILTATVKAGYNASALSGSYNGIYSLYDDARGDACTIGYDDFNDKIVVVSEHESGQGDATDAYWSWANVYVIDPVTGDVNQTVTLSDNADIYPNSIATYDAVGGVAIAGEKFGEYTDFGAITLLAGYNGYFDILKSEIDAEHYPGSPIDNYYDFWVTGTGISNMENVDDVNYYENLPTTVREGSGAQVTIGENGAGSYTLIGIAAGGTNYLPGHIIRVLGTDLGGTTPENDALLQIITVGSNGEVQSAGISGSAFATAPVGGWTASTVNYNVGSGATFYIRLNPDTGAYTYNGIFNQGSNYVAGDVITIPGTSFANGATPANDVTLTVASVDGLGRVGDISSTTGTGQTNALRIFVNGVDFSVEGSWSMKQNLGGEAFVWTPAWNKAIGGPTGDRFYDICYSEDGSALYAVGRGRYDVAYDQALVVKYNAANGTILWSKDIKFTEAGTDNREARAVCTVPGSTDIIVAGAWYNNNSNEDELILTRITAAGVAVWQKTYLLGAFESTLDIDYEMNIKAVDGNFVVSLEQSTFQYSRGIGMLVVDATGAVIRHRVLSSDGNSTYNYYNTPTANFADIYSDATGDYVISVAHTYVPTDNYYNALLTKLPVDGLVSLEIEEPWNLGEHILSRFDVSVTTVTSAFESFTPTEHTDTITNLVDQRDYTTRPPAGLLRVFTESVTKDSQGYLEFGDGSRQSFATNIVPQIRGANDYYLTTQDSGKHIFFEHENGTVYIPHRNDRYFPVGFTFTIVNTSGSDCWVRTQSGSTNRARLKLAGRNIDTVDVGIPDSGSGSMVTVMKIKDGYTMDNSDGNGDYPDIWIISGPGDLYNND